MDLQRYSQEELATELQQRTGASDENAREVAGKMLAIAPVLVNDLQKFWSDGTIARTEIEGWSMERLMRERSMKPLEALLTLDWLVREPFTASRSLTRGRDGFSRRTKPWPKADG
jgi:hypothetical protein